MKLKLTHRISLLLGLLIVLPTHAEACDKKSNNDACIEVTIKDKSGHSVPDIVVYLKPLDGQSLPINTKTVTISQQNKSFSPYISVSQTNTKANFVNQDDITHHIYSVTNDNKFAFSVKSGEEHLSQTFNKESEIAMGCNIHDWMSGYLLVVDTPYFGKTDPNGKINFSVSELGRYQVVVWHPQLSVIDHRVSETENITKDAVFQISLPSDLEALPTQSNDEDFDFVSGY